MKAQSIQDEQLAQLINECAGHNQAALAHINQTLGCTLLALCQQVLGDKASAETALHNGYASVWQKANKFNKQLQNSSAWITHLVREQALLLHNSTNAKHLGDATSNEPAASNEDTTPTAQPYHSAVAHTLLPEAYNTLAPEVLNLLEQLYFKASSYEQLGINTHTDAQTARHSARIGLGQLDTEANFDSPDKSWWIKQAGEFTLGVLRDDELKVFEKVRRHETDIQQLVDHWQVTLLPFAQALPPLSAPELNWQIIESVDQEESTSVKQGVIDSVPSHATNSLALAVTSPSRDAHALMVNESIGEYIDMEQSQRFEPMPQTNATELVETSVAISNEETLAELAQLKKEHARASNESIQLQQALSNEKLKQQALVKSAAGWRTFSALLVLGILSLLIGLAYYSHINPDKLNFLNFNNSATALREN